MCTDNATELTIWVKRKPLNPLSVHIPNFRECLESFDQKLTEDPAVFFSGAHKYANLVNAHLSNDEESIAISISPIITDGVLDVDSFNEMIRVLNNATVRIGGSFIHNDGCFIITGLLLYRDDGTPDTYDKPENTLMMAIASNGPGFTASVASGPTGDSNKVFTDFVDECIAMNGPHIHEYFFPRKKIIAGVEKQIGSIIALFNKALVEKEIFIKMGAENMNCRILRVDLSPDKQRLVIRTNDRERYFEHVANVIHFRVDLSVDAEDKFARLEFYGSVDSNVVPFVLLGVTDYVELTDFPNEEIDKSEIFTISRAGTDNDIFKFSKFEDAISKFDTDCGEHLTPIKFNDCEESDGYIVGCKLTENKQQYQLTASVVSDKLHKLLDHADTRIGAIILHNNEDVVMTGIDIYTERLDEPFQERMCRAICDKSVEDGKKLQ